MGTDLPQIDDFLICQFSCRFQLRSKLGDVRKSNGAHAPQRTSASAVRRAPSSGGRGATGGEEGGEEGGDEGEAEGEEEGGEEGEERGQPEVLLYNCCCPCSVTRCATHC